MQERQGVGGGWIREREGNPRNQEGNCWVENLAPKGIYIVPRKGFFKELFFAISSKYGMRRKSASRQALGGLVSFCLCQPQTTPWVLGREPIFLTAVAADWSVCLPVCVCVCAVLGPRWRVGYKPF